jgi:hypothetical protein
MAYVSPSFRTKKALKQAVQDGKEVFVFSPGPFPVSENGRVAVEGPSFQPHSWYATVEVKDRKVVRVVA